ncbi:MAG: hypothetical protein JJE35_03770 [Thermoleophilia bacterium]|nr:hypothetical protein [Thermoleophilia bacterium]
MFDHLQRGEASVGGDQSAGPAGHRAAAASTASIATASSRSRRTCSGASAANWRLLSIAAISFSGQSGPEPVQLSASTPASGICTALRQGRSGLRPVHVC